MVQPGRVVLISGVSSGIGRAIAQTLAQRGFQVFGTSRNASAVAPIANVEVLDLDVADQASVSRAVSAVMARAGRIDVLVNNAGIGLLGAAEESSADQMQRLFDVNVFGLARLVREVLPHMREQGSGRIVNISSALGLIPQPYMAVYAASKFAVEGYSESLDHELREFGIRSVLIEPAYTRTGFDSNLMSADKPLDTYGSQRAQASALVQESMRGADEPEVVAEVVLKALTAAEPAVRYPAGAVARRVALLRRFAPAAAFDKQIRKLNKLGPAAARTAVKTH